MNKTQDDARDTSTLADVRSEMQALINTIWRLRQPDGCPWDRAQTHLSIAKNMVEEAYEAVDAIEAQADDVSAATTAHLADELGDVLMQVLLHAQIAADTGEFTFVDVVRGLNEKLIRRHPHVFGEASALASTPDEVLGIWDSVKLAEKEAAGAQATGDSLCPAGLLDGVPRALPALMQAQKVSRKAASAGFEWETVGDVWAQVASERAEYESEAKGSEAAALEFGDMLFALVNVARCDGIDAESALRASTAKFRQRWHAMEGAAFAAGRSIESYNTSELNELWDAVKAQERLQQE